MIAETARVEPCSLANLAESLSHDAGALLLEMQGSRLTSSTKSSATDWVSEADRQAEAFIANALHTYRPDDGLVGEEGARSDSKNGYTWVVDPLDGTTNYLRGYPGWCVSVAVRMGDHVVAGVVYEPMTGTTWAAHIDGTSLRNGQQVNVAAPVALEDMLVGTGFSYRKEERIRQAGLLEKLLPEVADVRRCGSAALELARVADGTLDAFVESDLEPWDWAAGGFLMNELAVTANRGRRMGLQEC